METARGKTRDESITRLAELIDNYEKYSRPHSRVMAEMAALLARRLGLAQSDINAIAEAAMLHDIGLHFMSPAYHSSPGPLSFEDRIDLWRHSVIGEQQMAKRGSTRHAQLLVRWHHEWWNGTGYPDMLAFEDIPIGARALRAVELLSALAADRPYRAALSEEATIEALKSSAGIECDPYVVSALIALLDDLRAAGQQAIAPIIEPIPIEERSDPQGLDPMSHTLELASPGPLDSALTSAPEASLSTASAELMATAPPSALLPLDLMISRAKSQGFAPADQTVWHDWNRSRYNKKSLLGFQASVLRQIEFRSIAIAICGWARMEWYLKTWGKLIFSNDPRAWASAASRALIEARTAPSEEHIAELLRDVYVPGNKLANPSLRRWFGETDAWWMDNLRCNIERAGDDLLRAQAIYLGLQVGDYALSFTDQTRELRRPLATVFWRLAGLLMSGPQGHAHNRSFNLPVEEFARMSRADLFYLNLPAAQAERAGSEARSQWRESWTRSSDQVAGDEVMRLVSTAQSKHTYLSMVERILRAAPHIKTWAIEYQDTGLASAHDISELIKEHRPVQATYSKDLTEVAGGLRNYIFVAQKA